MEKHYDSYGKWLKHNREILFYEYSTKSIQYSGHYGRKVDGHGKYLLLKALIAL